MEYIRIERDGEIAIAVLCKGKVHELSEPAVDQIHNALRDLEKDESVRSVILTGEGKFFSFGLDIPGFLSYRKEMFTRFLNKFTDLYRYLFVYEKPLVAALNGHTIAGGCMLATSCDYRLMADEGAKIALNEITFGSTVFAGATAILKYLVGGRNAEKILLSGKMYDAVEAEGMGLVDEIADRESLLPRAKEIASEMGQKDAVAFANIKKLLREPLARLISNREESSISEFNEIWYSESTWKQIQEIKIKE